MFYTIFFIKPEAKTFKKKYVKIITPENTKIINLDNDKTLYEKGRLGFTEIRIKNRSVEIMKSPCPNKFCVHSGKIYKSNQILSCVPNGIYITIESEISEDVIDAVTK